MSINLGLCTEFNNELINFLPVNVLSTFPLSNGYIIKNVEKLNFDLLSSNWYGLPQKILIRYKEWLNWTQLILIEPPERLRPIKNYLKKNINNILMQVRGTDRAYIHMVIDEL